MNNKSAKNLRVGDLVYVTGTPTGSPPLFIVRSVYPKPPPLMSLGEMPAAKVSNGTLGVLLTIYKHRNHDFKSSVDYYACVLFSGPVFGWISCDGLEWVRP